MNWRCVDLSDPTALAFARSRSEAILTGHPDRHLFHTVDWLLATSGGNPAAVRAFFLEAPDGTVGYAPFVLQPWRLRFRLGEITLAARPLVRLHLMGGPLLAGGEDAPGPPTIALFSAVRDQLQSGQVVFLEGVPVDSTLGRLVGGTEAARLPFRALRYGAPSPRHFIRLPPSLDDYLGSLGKRTREGLRRRRRKLGSHLGDDLELRTITRAADVGAFVEAAGLVSRKTYQWHLLGLGLRDPDALRKRLEDLAEKGWTRCYLLVARGTPVAFMIGYQHRGIYHYMDVGFDPAWREHSVGTVMHLEVLEELITSDDPPEVFDFSTGTGEHKERFGTESRIEANWLLIPRGVRGRCLAAAYRTAEAVSNGLARTAEVLGIKAALKRWVRRSSSRSS
jgi:hypothetical protein